MFNILDFDIILGMHCLSKYGVNIDCKKEEVVFQPHGHEEFKFCGTRVQATPPLIFAAQVRKCVREGAYAYLAYVVAKPEIESKLKDIPVVHHYPNVFTKVTEFPPNHEIEFTIDLVPGTQPIHKAPYRMAPIKLKELKVQLQELLDQCFIQPSVSP